MATYTPNYNLAKPEMTDPTENFLSDFGANMDIIDQNLGGGGGGGGGGVSNFTETVLATASSFSDMTVDFSTAYDTFVFYANDATFQKAESYFFTRSEITDAINNNLAISFYPYGSAGICQYYITRSGLTRANNSAGFFIYKIVGLNFGSTPHIYSTNEQVIGTWHDGRPLYEKTIIFDTGVVAGNIDYNITSEMPANCEVVNDSFVMTYTYGGYDYRNVNSFGAYHQDNASHYFNFSIGSARYDKHVELTIQYTKTTD